MELASAASTMADEPVVKLRSYQDEMLEASLKRNVIVVMDTGSGKTHVAIFRILAELERSDSSKLVWFLAPAVALCEQQHAVLASHLPGYVVKLLVGRDGVDKWSDQRIWDAALTNVRVVVGTPKVLEDALTHGFVKTTRLSLLIFDEAHRCIKNGPMNTIMTRFYHPAKDNGQQVPHILGLSASPVMGAKLESLDKIEANLNAVARTPKQHRSELDLYVHPPEIRVVTYKGVASIAECYVPPLCQALIQALNRYDLSTDPYIIELSSRDDEKAQRDLAKQLSNPKTFCYRQLKTIKQRSDTLLIQLGATAAEWYVRQCIGRFLRDWPSTAAIMPDVKEQERRHLAEIFHRIQSTPSIVFSGTDKVNALISALKQHVSADLRAIVFVEQRAAVHALANLLQTHSETSPLFSIGTFVGVSGFYSKTPVADLMAAEEQQQHLEDFREGKLDLMIATNALEEGIDVTACNLVVCFDSPTNLVAFVQRRGRARQKGSKFVVLLDGNNPKSNPGEWQRLEARMKAAYLDELRASDPPELEDEDTSHYSPYRVESTGAVLTIENVKAHLYHFCAVSTLHASKYVDLRPTFDTTNNGGENPWTAHVQLPSFVHQDWRSASGLLAWRSENAAIKDASFQAYVALHQAGLVNNNLLPLTRDYGPEQGREHVDQPSIVQVSERISSWRRFFEQGKYDQPQWQAASVKFWLNDEVEGCLLAWLPVPLPSELCFPLFWNEETEYDASIRPFADHEISDKDAELLDSRRFTRVLLSSVHSPEMVAVQEDFTVLFSPCNIQDVPEQHNFIEGSESASTLTGDSATGKWRGLIRAKGQPGRAFFFHGLNYEMSKIRREPQLVVKSFPKRKDFLHPLNSRDEQNAAYTSIQSLPVEDCTVDRLRSGYAVMAAMAPCIIHRFDISLLLQHVQETVLKDVGMVDHSLIREAIAAPSANEGSDYNRLEFLGDTILKFCTVLQVLAQHPLWPEGYLHLEKDRIVNNGNLSKAALEAGLDQIIITKPFTGSKWRPTYVSDFPTSSEKTTREMSTKTLADVVEALIGAAHVAGGLEMSSRCIQTLLSKEQWLPQDECIRRLHPGAQQCRKLDLTLLERLVGYHFSKPSLLIEAITHVSCPLIQSGVPYERLEFLGDAVLDLIIVPKLFEHHRKLKHWELHRVKEALVNGNFLAFCCMLHRLEESTYDVVEQESERRDNTFFEFRERRRMIHLRDFLRANSQVIKAGKRAMEAFEELREPIIKGLESGSKYPWPDLLALQPPKFISDMVESVLGAIYLDTFADLSACETFLEKLGVMKCLHRFLDDNVETATPKEQLGILAGYEKVACDITQGEGEDGTRPFTCSVKIGEEVVATVNGCRNKTEAEARAAAAAVDILEGRRVAGAENQRKRKLDVGTEQEREGHEGL